ncbi:MAG: SusC/RagA family TonB-linked outer membrane protein [Chitinophagaceae bacterium]|nr:SusC/RagA family TonB-linked outer membrane protein [Chitinophagaceae bacterium]
MKSKKLFLLFLSFVITGLTYGQTRVTGHVVNKSGEPIAGVSVTVKGSNDKGTLTDNQGNFTLTVPAGSKTLALSHVTMKPIEVAIKPNLTITMEESSATLDEVEITAEFGMKRIARGVGSSAQTIKGSDVSESGRESFISALQGRISGMNITTTSGTPGASTTVVLRNLTSISGNNTPLYVVDGVPMNNSSYDPIDMFTGGTERFSVRNQDYSSRGNDINPQDIESITVLKGAAAAALYGSDASNGAIIITTKKGRAGKGRVTYSNNLGWSKAYGYPDLQDKYANGSYGTTNYYYTAHFGAPYPAGMKTYDNIAQILQTGFSGTHNLTVEGGSENATIRVGFSQLNQTGVVKTSAYDRTNISVAGKAKVGNWLNIESTMQYAHTKNDKVPRGTDGPLYRAMIWPMVDNMADYLTPDGVFMRYPNYYTDEDLLNPLFGLYKNKYQDKADRFLSNIAVTVTPTRNTFVRAQLGWDVGMQTFVSSVHPYYAASNNGQGYYYLTNQNFSDPTINILAGYNNKFFDNKFSVSAQVGYHQLENAITRLTTNGSKFTVPDFQSINNVDVATIVSSQRNTKRRIQALSGQFEFGYNNLAFLTFRARNDWSSTLPVDNNTYFYPAVEASFILSDLKAFKSVPFITYLKLRGSIAQVGKDAGPLEIDPQLEATGLAGGGFKYGFTGPNKNLRPEMNTSKEIGFETRLWDNRINADFTYFFTHCDDQIVKNFRLSYATGFVLNTMNVGAFDTWGWEGHIDADIVRNPSGLRWNVGVNMSQVKSEVVSLPANVTEYYNPYTWNSGNIRNGISQGNPITTLTGLAYQRNDAGDILISPTSGLPLVDSKWSIIGDREPKLRYGLVTSLDYGAWRFSALFSGRLGATVVNGTKRLMMTQGISWESVALREGPPVVFNGVLKDGEENTKNPTKNTIAVDYSLYGSMYGGGDEDWLEKDVKYLRMQEVRLSYRIPSSLLKKTKVISNADLFVVGNDLAVWTNYSGIDAVGNTMSAAAGGTGGEGYDVWSLPMPRTFAVGFTISFN